MAGCRFQFDFLNSLFFFFKSFSFAGHSCLVIFGLILVNYTIVSSRLQTSVKCKSVTIFSTYQHCRVQPDGVHDLECFSKYKKYPTCVWRPGKHTFENIYTLIITHESKSDCRAFINITKLFESIKVFKDINMTAQVFEISESRQCTKAVFRSPSNSLSRCGPPYHVSFYRESGKLNVRVSWDKDDTKAVESYYVRYKAQGSLLWNKSPVQSQNQERCTVEKLNSSQVYIVQIQCVTNEKCFQCPWTETYTVPSELTTKPVIINLKDTDFGEGKGKRLLSLKWKFPDEGLHDGYYLTIGKASEERPCEQINTTQPEIRLILSYSSYHINISAVNNVSTSPPLSLTTPQREDLSGFVDGRLNVTVQSNTSFTAYWKDDLIKTYVCYSAEWGQKGHKVQFMSFYENGNNYWTFSPLQEPLEPYKRYSITLHIRPEKETCNMKYINNSESTYGTTQFYFMEGSPVSAPTNVSSCNVTLNAAVLQWSSILEDDLRGFLLGYIIQYTEYNHMGISTESNITVDPESETCELKDLKVDTVYHVQISGYTIAGVGVPSTLYTFKTNHQEYFDITRIGVITIFAVGVTVLMFFSMIMKRAKVILWPNIPNPGNSNAMQKIDKPCEVELLQFSAVRVEECGSNSFQLVEKKAAVLPNMLPLLPLNCDTEDEGESLEMTGNCIQRDSEDATGDMLPDETTDTFSTVNQSNAPFAFSSEYTTMEMFQQVVPQAIVVNTAVTQAAESDAVDTQGTVVESGLNYIRQFSASPTFSGEETDFAKIFWDSTSEDEEAETQEA